MKKYKLGELINVKRGMSLSGEHYATEGNLIRLTLGNFQEEGGFKINTSKDDLYFTGPVREEFILKEGDIITPLTEQVVGLLGATARIPESGKYIQSGDVALIKCISDEIDDGYCYYLVSSDLVRRQLSAAAQQTKIRHTSPEKIMDCEVFIPEVKEQKKIAKLLDDINRKIELNNKINDNLAQYLKDLYVHWFLQYDFPDSAEKPYKASGGKLLWNAELKRSIPDNWNVAKLGDLFDSERGISYSTPNISSGKGNPMINLASFAPGGGAYKPTGLKHFDGTYASSKVLHPYELVMCNTQQTAIDFDKDIIGRAMLIPDIFDEDILSSHHVNVIRPYNVLLKEYLLFLFNSDFFHKYISGHTNGTNILGLVFSGVEDYKTEIPPDYVLERFSNTVLKVEAIKSSILRENSNLNAIRKFLMPMLMSSQATITD